MLLTLLNEIVFLGLKRVYICVFQLFDGTCGGFLEGKLRAL